MSTVAPQPSIDRPNAAETRIAAYLLTDYLERLGVEVVFGLCGHTVIALLDALGQEPHPVRHRRGTSRSRRTRPTATRARPASPACC